MLQVTSRNIAPLNPVTLQSMPTLYTEKPWGGVSEHYAFLSTGRVIDTLQAEGILPYSVRVTKTRIDDKQGFTKHVLRFRPSQSTLVPDTGGGVYPEVVLTNSHDRGSSFIIELGLFRLVCSNGLMVSSGTFSSYRVRHVKATIEDVLEATYSIIGQFPEVSETVSKFQNVMLSDSQRYQFAEAASLLRWDAEKRPFDSARLLQPRRQADQGSSLWNVYNVIQENLTQGQAGSSWRRHGRMAVLGSRAIGSIDTDQTINRSLWALADSFAIGAA